jgi:hypothetical protein
MLIETPRVSKPNGKIKKSRGKIDIILPMRLNETISSLEIDEVFEPLSSIWTQYTSLNLPFVSLKRTFPWPRLGIVL